MTTRLWASTLLTIALVGFAVAGPAQGQRSTGKLTPTTVQPKGPPDAAIAAAWPGQARELGIEGAVELSCTFPGTTRPSSCSINSERPAGMGFGQAALSLVPQISMEVVNGDDGKPARIGRRVPIAFKCGDACKPFAAWDLSIQWSEAPTGDDVREVYPPAALAAGAGGIAIIACRFNAAGHPDGCRVDAERPAGQGFGAAALALAVKFRALGNLTDAPIRIPVRFQVAGGQVTTAAPPARRAPSVLDLYGALPAGAAGPGQATLACRIGRQGKFDACAARLEQPEGQGFGQAALGLSEKYSFNLWNTNGLPVIGAVLAAPFSFPDPKGPRPSIITNPDWLQQPTPGQMGNAYPDRALRRGISGRATIICTVQADGRVTDCKIDEESPANEGFGEAALSLSPNFVMRPQTKDGAPVGGARVSIPVIFGPQ